MTNLEHGIVFWGLGLFTISMLALLSYATVYGEGGNLKGIDFIVGEGKAIGSVLGTTIGSVFLLIAGLMLFGTQFTVLDSTSRIITENYVLAKPTKERVRRIPKTYYVVLWLQLLFGIAVFLVGFTEPRTLVTLGAVFNALAMFISFFLIFVLNHKILPKELRASMLRKTIIIVAFAFFGYFASYAFLQAFGVIS
ncbi:MAG: hypothetical protein BWY68_00769 [bacterium ADurb.Bin400]|nr:MAG: hypothetical protein BWY68_00769 [bacterium ADurb.Bin400]